MSLTLTWELFYLALIQMIAGISHFINTVIFFVEPNFLKSISFSILMVNLIKFCETREKKGWQRTLLLFYAIYCFVAFFPPQLAYIDYMTWYEMVLFLPYVVVIFFGGLLKFTSFGKRYLNYYCMFGYYMLIIIIWLIVNPTDGLWYWVLLYAFILYVLANAGGIVAEKPI